MTRGAVVVDLRAVQSPDFRGRGIGRWVHEHAAALERARPEVVGAYLVDPEWPPPGVLDEIVGSGKVHYSGTPAAVAACERAAIYHCPSPIELGRTMTQIRPPYVDHHGMRYSVIVYDLIPLHERERYLVHPAARRRYMARLEVVRSADAVLAISDKVASDVRRDLGVAAARCHVVGSGVAARFVPPASRAGALAALAREHPDIDRPFVLFPAGSDPRKNVEGLIAAFGLLPAHVRNGLGLVVLGDFAPNFVAHYRRLAADAGIGRSLVLTGFVSDETLLRCYQAASLVAFPSLAEGFGLPVAEALACGAVCCVSDRPPLSELVADARARFDPADPQDMAAVMARCVTDAGLQASLRADADKVVTSWDAVAERAVSVWEQMADGSRRPWRRRRRVAVVSPFPPIRSGVAGYSAAMVAAMHRVDARRAEARGASGVGSAASPLEIDCFVDGRNRSRVDPLPVAGALPVDAALFERFDGVLGGYEHVVYVLGNSEHHANALGALRRRRGTVLAHEVRLSGLLALSATTRGAAPGGLSAAIERNYPGLPEGLGHGDRLDDADTERYGLYLLKDVVRDAERCALFSDAARRLAVLDVGPDLDGRLAVVPFALSCLDEAQRRAVETARATRSAQSAQSAQSVVAAGAGTPATVSSFGIVHPQKRPGDIVLALAELRRRGHDVVVQFVGPVGDAMRDALTTLASTEGVEAYVELTGVVDDAEYLARLGRTDVAVQLRRHFFGECSLTVGECLSAGVPTVVSSTGWMGELPDDAVAKVDPEAGVGALADILGQLVTTAERRRRLGDSGRAWAETQTYELVAEAVLDLLGV